ncbi:hypothetical protein KFL_003970060 [Klebsormidium nitens]|uniref:Uncharacterized protein n=1 Tax=Klebsormidium nitens TaxID=105231 RepID=A0A1Y1IF34_KLENI|nr:hypothetical protein KFL_003970060 [Klebsormidium nitens]|eukprot:GAQ88059.1 hypothetical protein KFL_003970060 [Klebsormidium nitens]
MALEAHPFTSFNKPGANGTQTLIGNWVEERVLEQSTSYSRYKDWASTAENGGSVYPRKVPSTATAIETAPRVMPTSEDSQAAATHFMTVKQETYADPKRTETDVRTAHYVDMSKLGKKGAKMVAELWREASALPEPEPPSSSFETTNRTVHGPLDTSLVRNAMKGSRVMKTQDGKLIPAECRDGTFQSELGLLPLSSLNRNASFGQEPDLDAPITIYSTSKEGDFAQTRGAGAVRFGKSCRFSKPIDDPTKVVTDQ